MELLFSNNIFIDIKVKILDAASSLSIDNYIFPKHIGRVILIIYKISIIVLICFTKHTKTIQLNSKIIIECQHIVQFIVKINLLKYFIINSLISALYLLYQLHANDSPKFILLNKNATAVSETSQFSDSLKWWYSSLQDNKYLIQVNQVY